MIGRYGWRIFVFVVWVLCAAIPTMAATGNL